MAKIQYLKIFLLYTHYNLKSNYSIKQYLISKTKPLSSLFDQRYMNSKVKDELSPNLNNDVMFEAKFIAAFIDTIPVNFNGKY